MVKWRYVLAGIILWIAMPFAYRNDAIRGFLYDIFRGSTTTAMYLMGIIGFALIIVGFFMSSKKTEKVVKNAK
ncbi:hypothetical protein HOA55_05080 [archaeon]|jgi:glucose uptake protein GlcU|nr:hypothetical protein [archaeon]MBT3578154.1 hypothetical protein [archaeon]MBT6820702.1 hypothetical protein [archaeon]MBT6956708.1 hypothetical protein [archaeon]MBT7024889.1 hypothetical protein [archaeon]